MKKLILLIFCLFLFSCKKETLYYVNNEHFELVEYEYFDDSINLFIKSDIDVSKFGIVYTTYLDNSKVYSNTVEFNDTLTNSIVKVVTVNCPNDLRGDTVVINAFGYSLDNVDNNVDKEYVDTKTYSVNFYLDSLYRTSLIKSGEKVLEPMDPVKEGYIFIGWYKDNKYEVPFDFNLGITEDLNLYAYFIRDYTYVTNEIETNYIKSTIRVTKNSYTSTSQYISNGSGVIFKEDEFYYYALTNNHVLTCINKELRHNLTITTYNGVEIEGEIINSDPNYDLGVVRFLKTENLLVINLANSVMLNETCISIGTPKGQANMVTYGEVLGYMKVVPTSDSNVTFNVIKHTGYINSGSSGGALLNSNFELIGINFAGGFDDSNNFLYANSIPIIRVKEYLNKISI